MPQQDRKIDYLEFPARDFRATREFYQRLFGWVFTAYGDDYLAFNDGKLDGGFYLSELSATTSQGSALVVMYAENLEQVFDEVVASGGAILKPIFSFPGGRRFQFADPNGNELAVWSDK
ncbi:MAG: VOC family protein [Planctomycetales bacterium]|nr:VOC family protein [Planctomycetales bacterium]